MIVIRNSFQLKFGKSKDAVAAMKEAMAAQKKGGINFPTRLLTDLTGPFYTLVLEITIPDLAAWENDMRKAMTLPDFQAAYQKFVQYVESGDRQMYTLVE